LGVLLFSAVIATTGLVYGHYRYNHIPVRYADIVLPWRWSHVTEAKARNYVEQYNRYMGVGQWGRAAQALSLAYQIHPNTDYGVRLAQMWALLAEYTWSDQVYASLIRDHPEQRDALIYDWTRMLIARRADFQLRRLAEQELAAHPEHFAWTRYYIDLLRQNSDALREAQVKATPLHWLLQAELQARQKSPHWVENVTAQAPDTPYGVYFTTRLLLHYRQYDAAKSFTLSRRSKIPEFILQDLELYNDDYPVLLRRHDLRQLLTSDSPQSRQLAITYLIRDASPDNWEAIRPEVVKNLDGYPQDILFSLLILDVTQHIKDLTIYRELQRRFPNTPLNLSKLYTTANPTETTLFYRSIIYFTIPPEILWQTMSRYANNNNTDVNVP
jgi:hypothetical protein